MTLCAAGSVYTGTWDVAQPVNDNTINDVATEGEKTGNFIIFMLPKKLVIKLLLL